MDFFHNLWHFLLRMLPLCRSAQFIQSKIGRKLSTDWGSIFPSEKSCSATKILQRLFWSICLYIPGFILNLTLFRMMFQNKYSKRREGGGAAKTPSPLKWLLWLNFWGFCNIIPLGHKWKAWCHKISPLAIKLLVLEPKQNLNLELENQVIPRFCYMEVYSLNTFGLQGIDPIQVPSPLELVPPPPPPHCADD